MKEAVWLANVDCAAVLEIGGDAGGPEGVAAYFFGQASGLCPLLDHPQGVVAMHRAGGELAAAVDGPEEGGFPLSGDACRFQIGIDVAFGIMVGARLRGVRLQASRGQGFAGSVTTALAVLPTNRLRRVQNSPIIRAMRSREHAC